MLQWVFFFFLFFPFQCDHWLWFNLLRFCCWIAVLRSRQFNNCHRIISVLRDGTPEITSDLRLRRRSSFLRPFLDYAAGEGWSRVAPCDPPTIITSNWGEEKNKQKTSASVANEMSMHWEKTVVQIKQPESKITNPWDHTHTHTHTHTLHSNPSTNTTSTLCTHSFMHTHEHTHIHTEPLIAEWFSLSTFAPSRTAFVVVIEHFLC